MRCDHNAGEGHLRSPGKRSNHKISDIDAAVGTYIFRYLFFGQLLTLKYNIFSTRKLRDKKTDIVMNFHD